jgi:hypothetical protein
MPTNGQPGQAGKPDELKKPGNISRLCSSMQNGPQGTPFAFPFLSTRQSISNERFHARHRFEPTTSRIGIAVTPAIASAIVATSATDKEKEGTDPARATPGSWAPAGRLGTSTNPFREAQMNIGFIGVGLMGGPLARNLIRGNKEVLVYDLSQDAEMRFSTVILSTR